MRRPSNVHLIVLFLTAALVAPASLSAQTPPLFPDDQLTSALLATADVELFGGEGQSIVLDQLTITPDLEFDWKYPESPQLMYVLSGSLSYNDEFGFAVDVGKGDSFVIRPEITYEVTSGEDGAVVIRLADADSLDGWGLGSPAPDRAQGIALIDQRMPSPLSGNYTMFIGSLTIQPGESIGPFTHPAPVGLYVDAGVISVVTPSGTSGKLAAGNGAMLPADADLKIANASNVATKMYVAGFAPIGSSVFVNAVVATIAPATIQANTTETPASGLQSESDNH